MEEKVFMEMGDDLVTSSRIVLAGKTFATRNVSAVSINNGSFGFVAGLIITLGLLFLIGGAWFFGLLVMVGGTWYGVSNSKERTIMLTTGGSEVPVKTTSDNELAQKLHDSISNAIAVR